MSIFALIDCNNFYASCERVFQPKLNKKPLIVLSNNDGCVIARSQEAKKLGISMGVPVFKIKNIIQKHSINTFSSNYALYGDMSSRVMSILAEKCPDIEIYSIDEAFLDLESITNNPVKWCKKIRQTIFKWVGIPVSIGIGPTKTLAKVANKIAKSDITTKGVFSLYNTNDVEIDMVLQNIHIEDVWGIGRQWSKMLHINKIFNALELKKSSEIWIRKKMGITGLRTLKEIKGIPCHRLELEPIQSKSVRCSRTFGRAVGEKEKVFDAIRLFVQIAASKIRKKKLACRAIQVFVSTDRFNKNIEQYSNSAVSTLITPTSDSIVLVLEARRIFNRLWKDRYLYRKGGVLLLDLFPKQTIIPGFFPDTKKENYQLMQAIDKINEKFGRNCLELGIKSKKSEWKMKQHNVSSKFTTRWKDIIKVSAN